MAKRAPLLLATVLLLALLLRVWGLTWGLPTATHYFSYHPDESVVLGAAMSINVFGGQILPHFYNYGSLQLYLVNIAVTFASAYGGGSLVIKDLAHDWPQWAHMYLVGRILTVLMGVGTVWGVYALGKELWGRRAGLLGAALLAVMPLHAQQSHFLTVDVPAAFWGTWALFWAARVLKAEQASRLTMLPQGGIKGGEASLVPTPPELGAGGLFAPPPYERGGRGEVLMALKSALRGPLLAGILVGLAVATKYNMALLLFPIAFAVLTGRSTAKQKTLALIAAVLAMGAAFLLTCPGVLLETDAFLRDVRFESVHMQNTDDPTFHATGNGFLYQVTTNMAAGMGWPLLILALISLIFASSRRTKEDALLTAFALPYFVLISVVAIRYARYDIPLLPLLALWIGRLLADGLRTPHPILSRITLFGATAVGLLTLANTVTLLRPMTQTDPRDAALTWLDTHAPSPTPIAFAAQPWFGTAPVSPYFSMSKPGGWQAYTPADIRQRILYGGSDWNVETLEKQKPPFVILSEYDYRDPSRLLDPAWAAYMTALDQHYTQAAVFPSPAPPAADGNDYSLPIHTLPHDMLYPDPSVVIYRKKP